MYTKNSNELIAPASLTKLMTALILYENYPLNHEFITSYPDGYKYSGKVAYIPSGIVITTEELLELILIYSAMMRLTLLLMLFLEIIKSLLMK